MDIAVQSPPSPPGYAFADRPGGARPDGGRRAETLRLGLWLFLGTVTMLFAAFTSAYIVRRSGSDWSRIILPTGLGWNTVALIASSLALEVSAGAGRRRRWPLASGAIAAALLLGVAFLAGQVAVWRGLLAAGVYLPSGPHSAFFYLLTGAHAIHAIAALIVLAVAAVFTAAVNRRRDLARWALTMELTRTFWHFLLAVWLLVFALLAVL